MAKKIAILDTTVQVDRLKTKVRRVKIAVASGGATKSGTFYVTIG